MLQTKRTPHTGNCTSPSLSKVQICLRSKHSLSWSKKLPCQGLACGCFTKPFKPQRTKQPPPEAISTLTRTSRVLQLQRLACQAPRCSPRPQACLRQHQWLPCRGGGKPKKRGSNLHSKDHNKSKCILKSEIRQAWSSERCWSSQQDTRKRNCSRLRALQCPYLQQ